MSVNIVVNARPARRPASCQPSKPHHLTAAPPVENRTAARTIFERGLIVPRRGARNMYYSVVHRVLVVTLSTLLLAAFANAAAADSGPQAASRSERHHGRRARGEACAVAL